MTRAPRNMSRTPSGEIVCSGASGSRDYSVQRGIERHGGQELEPGALSPQDPAPQPLGIVGEDVLGQGRLQDPRLLPELLLQLALPPPRVAGEGPGPAHSQDGLGLDV